MTTSGRIFRVIVIVIALTLAIALAIILITTPKEPTMSTRIGIALQVLVDGKYYYCILIDDKHFNNIPNSKTIILGQQKYLLLDPNWWHE